MVNHIYPFKIPLRQAEPTNLLIGIRHFAQFLSIIFYIYALCTKSTGFSGALPFLPDIYNQTVAQAHRSFEESVDDLFLGFLLGQSERHQFDQLLPGNFSDRRLVNE